MMGRDGIWLHAGSRLWLGSISDPAKRSPLGGIASPTQCLSRERQGWVKRSADPTPARHGLPVLGLRLRLDPTYIYLASAQSRSARLGPALSRACSAWSQRRSPAACRPLRSAPIPPRPSPA